MALVSNSGGYSDNEIAKMISEAFHDRGYAGEDAHTRLMLKHGYAVEADKSGGSVEPRDAPFPTESAQPPVPIQRKKPQHQRHPRLLSLKDVARRIDGSRRKD
jgi:hypothetical protein